MPHRKYGNQMKLRQNVSTTVHDQIYHKRCLHIDAWLYELPTGELYFIVQHSAGGQQVINTAAYTATPNGVSLYPGDAGMIAAKGALRYTGNAWQRDRKPWLSACHAQLQRHYRTRDARFTGPPSVRLWYVYSDPRINDPWEGIENIYNVTRKGVTAPRDTGPMTVVETRPRSPWSAKERSMLRTLDKLLK